jgi:hypothetical protein
MAKKRVKPPKNLGTGQDISKFVALKDELWITREYAPQVTRTVRRGKTRVEGDILGFVRGLRLSARLIYILRPKLRDQHIEVNWGHLLDQQRLLCSPECDVILHMGGSEEQWNGHGGDKCVMDFHFVQAEKVKAVISCKSKLTSIDVDFLHLVKSQFKVKHVLLFAESVPTKSRVALVRKAKKCGYSGLWYLYEIGKDRQPVVDENVYLDFLSTVKKLSN